MLLHLAPRDWFFIFMALLLCSYIKLAGAKSQKEYQVRPIMAKSSIFALF